MSSFLQSPEWQAIQEAMGRKCARIAGALVIRHDLPLGFHYLYSPRAADVTREFFSEAERLAKASRAVFLKIDPIEPVGLSAIGYPLGARQAYSLQPSHTLIVDCRSSDATLQSRMHAKTRYNIHLAERKGVLVRSIPAAEAREAFNDCSGLFSETAKRDGFRLHPQEHYRVLFSAADRDFENELWVAEYQGKKLASAIVNWFRPGMTATYLHGASSGSDRNVMAPQLLQWRIMQAVRERGYTTYDLGGIDDQRWPGLTRFKQGFGGVEVTFPPSTDYLFRPILYTWYRIQHQFRHAS